MWVAKKANSLLGCVRKTVTSKKIHKFFSSQILLLIIVLIYSVLVRHICSAGSRPGLSSTREAWTYHRETIRRA